MGKVLIVDDEADLRGIVKDVLDEEGFTTLEAVDGLSALKIFKKTPPDVVLLDLKMPYMDGIETLKEMKAADASVPVIILTGQGDIQTAVEAVKLGAYDFTSKPPDFDRLILSLRRAVERRELETAARKSAQALEASLENLLGRSHAMKKVAQLINQIAATNFSVIIQGETGTGKSVIAEAIHNLSGRSGRPFVSVDIGLIPDHLVESELFGYRKGAFTGADKDKAGYLETAHMGTIFIDELENMSPQVQSKLLGFIENRKVYPLGGTIPLNVDARVIAASNRDLSDCVSKKSFREDLFFRLSEFSIELPPLRERIEDIPFFAKKFLIGVSSDLNRQIKGISDEALTFLMGQTWPGNLRELRNVIRRAVVLSESDTIERPFIENLMSERPDEYCVEGFCSLKDAVRNTEKSMIKKALQISGGNKSKAAEMLQISYRSFFDKIKEYGIE